MTERTPPDKEPVVGFLDVHGAELAAIGYRVPGGAKDGSDIGAYFKSDTVPGNGLNQKVHGLTLEGKENNRGPTALCLSGGGIRSATLNLGTLQALASAGVLPKFDYLSTVSGGGYIGGWLSAWVKRKGGIENVSRLLNQPKSGQEPEAAEIRHLREFSNYLAPRKGILSPDTWTLFVTYLRNLILNWFVLIPLFGAALCVPRLLVAVHFWLRSLRGDDITPWRWGLGLASVVLTGWAFFSAGRMIPSARARRLPQPEKAGRLLRLWNWFVNPKGNQHDFFWRCLFPLVLAALAMSLYWRLHVPRLMPWSDRAWWYFATGLAASVFGWMAPGSGWKPRLLGFFACTVGGLVAGGGLLGTAFVLRLINRELRDAQFQSAIGSVHVTLVGPLILAALSLGATLYIGLTSRLTSATDDDREWWGRFGAWVSIVTVVWLAGCAVVLLLPALLLDAGSIGQSVLSIVGGASGLTAVLLGKSPDTDGTGGRDAKPTRGQRIEELLLSLTAPAFILFFVSALSLGLSALLEPWVPTYSRGWDGAAHFAVVSRVSALVDLEVIVFLSGVGLLLAWGINSNRFSLHAMYRDRLIRAYLGALEMKDRSPDPFTGFDPDDNILMHRLAPEAIALHELSDDALDRLSILGTFDDQAPAGRRKRSPLKRVLSLARLVPEEPGSPEIFGLSQHSEDALRRAHAERKAARQGVKKSYCAETRQRVLDDLNAHIFSADTAGSVRDRSARVRSVLDPEKPAAPGALRPLHVVNAALNVVRNTDAAWQDRKAESFTFSPLHCGFSRNGYRPSSRYGGEHGIGLGGAVTISGAAASPNMGYHSSPPVTFLLALFNVRLGSWLGNPDDPKAWVRDSPKLGLLHLVSEFFGLVDTKHKYVYLSDGGHFENLGLYEMVRRRCRTIVVVDAGCDEKFNFDDLGNAVRKIRADLGADIRFDGALPMTPRDLKKVGSRVAFGTIDYSRMDGPPPDGHEPTKATKPYTGRLVYIKSSFYGTESADVYSYARSNPQFPHESTADQFFSESQFESYRALGEQIVREIGRVKVDEAQSPDKLDLFVARAAEMADQASRPPANA